MVLILVFYKKRILQGFSSNNMMVAHIMHSNLSSFFKSEIINC